MFFTRLHRALFLYDDDESAGGAGATGADDGQPTHPAEGSGTDGGATHNWEERYKEAQVWGTRNAQRAAELEQEAQITRALRSDNAQERQQALEALGLSFVDDGDGDDQLYETDPRMRAELEELKAWREQTTSQQQSEANYAAFRQVADPEMQRIGVPDGLYDVIAEAALGLPPVHTPQGQRPDIQGAWTQFEQMAEQFAAIPAVQTAVKKAWANTKPTAAFTQPGGRDGQGVPAFKTGEERREFMLTRFRADQ